MKILLLISMISIAQAEIVTTYYGVDEVFRVEKAVCRGSPTASKIIYEKTEELREIAILDSDDKVIEEAGPTNKPLLREKVEEIFVRAKACGDEIAKPNGSTKQTNRQ